MHLLYPRLLASIFGFDFSKGWLLHSAKLRNLERVQHFLGPQGCLWKLVEKLEKDTFLRYEFPVTCLPVSMKNVSENVSKNAFLQLYMWRVFNWTWQV